MIAETAVRSSKSSILLSYFEFISIINLPNRVDRRREMESQLNRLGSAPNHGRVEFFPAIRVSARDDWPSLGARGCFLSHYTVLKQARDRGLHNILVMEDDCEFKPVIADFEHEIVRTLNESPWDIVYLGYREQPYLSGPPTLVSSHRPITCAHFYAVNGTVLGRLVDFLEQVMQRPEGHPEGGPQHYDGALTMFRAQNKDMVTLIATPGLAGQRSSRSDIHSRWFDQVPGLRTAANGLRRTIRRVR
jgi:glycosyl transferase family 25